MARTAGRPGCGCLSLLAILVLAGAMVGVVEESTGESIGGVAGAVLVALVLLAILRRVGRSPRADEEQVVPDPSPSRPQPTAPSLHPESPRRVEPPPAPPAPAGDEPREHRRLSSEEMIARAKRRIAGFGSDR